MMLQEFDRANSFARFSNGKIEVTSQDHISDDEVSGYFQQHECGLVVFVMKADSPYFQIGEETFLVKEIKSIDYKVYGDNRSLLVETNTKHQFSYTAFWIHELHMLEFAFGYPDDKENDLIKVIVDFIKYRCHS